MRKKFQMMVRDYKLLKCLSRGPATRRHIYEEIYAKKGSKKETRRRIMIRRLAKLERAGLIASTTCPTVADTIYYLLPQAAPIVASLYGMEVSYIPTNYNANTLQHDLFAAGCHRKIRKDAEDKKLYKLSYVIPECGLKKGSKLKRGVYFPDLLFAIKNGERTDTVYLEVDCGNISRLVFAGKMNYFSGTILVVTQTATRLALLLRYLAADGITKPVYLTTLKSFFAADLPACKWDTNFSKEKVSLDIF